MKDFTVTVTIRARDEFYADRVREEVAGALQDAQDAGELEGMTQWAVGDLVEASEKKETK